MAGAYVFLFMMFLRRVPSMYHLLAPVIIFISLFSRHAKSEDIFFKQLYGSCSTNSYMLTIYTSKPFSGRLFSKNFKECLSLGNGTRNLILSVGLSCGAEFEKGLKFSDQIYVQKDPYLQQVDDEVNLRTRFAVNESKDSLETDKGHVRTAEWHNEVDNEVDEGVYVQAWMDLLPLLSGYQHFFFIGQNVSLIIKWKNPKSKHQPKVGSCFASSGKKESLRLTNPAGQSCRLIFASKVPIILEARAENIDDDQGSEAKFNSLNQEIPSHYLRSDDLSAQESTQELLEIERDFEEPLVCMSRLKMVLAFGVLILVLFIALVFSCMLWSRAKSFTSQLNSNTKFPGGLIPRPFKRIPGPYVSLEEELSIYNRVGSRHGTASSLYMYSQDVFLPLTKILTFGILTLRPGMGMLLVLTVSPPHYGDSRRIGQFGTVLIFSYCLLVTSPIELLSFCRPGLKPYKNSPTTPVTYEKHGVDLWYCLHLGCNVRWKSPNEGHSYSVFWSSRRDISNQCLYFSHEHPTRSSLAPLLTEFHEGIESRPHECPKRQIKPLIKSASSNRYSRHFNSPKKSHPRPLTSRVLRGSTPCLSSNKESRASSGFQGQEDPRYKEDWITSMRVRLESLNLRSSDREEKPRTVSRPKGLSSVSSNS
ncbi:unnamed protein product [Lepeophtheirus salmonis]|uniref:(salmon louse) hypothetical protein n=1 Tax=Lepeophtheirus salmonis TaxID=72036 RepID=A0A7R8CDN8_LEPSM|nr:unnamed protein product [Lepeophtheirus salmonis]CAF2751105.1 unnamed protein product [Lepeophtheirus salmonis]